MISVSLPSGLAGYVAAFSAILLIYALSIITYNLFLHPLRSFPGHVLNRATWLPWARSLTGGTLPFDVLRMHDAYGPVVRVSPSELAFLDPSAWRDIYGSRAGQLPGGGDELPKHYKSYRMLPGIPTSIATADREEHGPLRKLLARGFSDKAMQEQEGIIGGYVDLLMTRLRQKCTGADGRSPAVNMTAWYNFTTFDIIGDLAFGEPFGCLERSSYDVWVQVVNSTVKQVSYLQVLNMIGASLLVRLAARISIKSRRRLQEMTGKKLTKRIEMGEGRQDLMGGLLQKQDELKLDMPKLQTNASTLIIAGSETTATLLTGITYLLLMNPACLEKVTREVRTAFASESEIRLMSVGNLTYMMACLNEALRLYPPVASGMPREVPPGGATIAGHFVPAGTKVSVVHFAMYHTSEYWKDPFSYRPERFLGDEEFASDRLDSLQPFHVGPRNCVGRNLAYAEMRLILARMLFNFDLELAEDSKHWLKDQKVFVLWEKPPLNVYLTPVKR